MNALKPSTRLSLCLLFCTLGFWSNLLKLPLFFNVDFLVGSFFVVLAIMTIGSVSGAVAGFFAGTCTYLLWNHPWAIFIFAGEAIFVGMLYSKRFEGPL